MGSARRLESELIFPPLVTLTMHQSVAANPEEHEAQQILHPEAHHPDPSVQCVDLGRALRSCPAVRRGHVLADIAAAALEESDDETVQHRREEVQRKSCKVCQAEDARNETREARRNLCRISAYPPPMANRSTHGSDRVQNARVVLHARRVQCARARREL